MSRLAGMTIAEFKSIVEDMRRVYPFKDENAQIVDTRDEAYDAHMVLDLYTYDAENDVKIRMHKGIGDGDRWVGLNKNIKGVQE